MLLPYSAFSFSLFRMTTWPSGLRRVTRNHFSSGGVGSNPAVVVFLCPSLSDYDFFVRQKKWFHPDSNWGPENQNLICCPYTMEPLYDCALSSFLFPTGETPPVQKEGTIGFEPMTEGTAVPRSTTELCTLLFLSPFFLSVKKRPPWVSNPRPYG